MALPQESTLAKEGVKDQHALRIERKKKIVPIPIPIPMKKGEPVKPVYAKPPEAEPGAETPAEKAPPPPKEFPEPVKKVGPAPVRRPPAARPILPPLRRPIRRPPFLRRIPNQFWGCATPFNIILILFILMFCCILGILTQNIQLPLAGCQAQPVAQDIDDPVEPTLMEPISCSEAAFTFENPAAVEAYMQGEYNQNSGEIITDPSFEEIDFALETGKIVLLPNTSEGHSKIAHFIWEAINRIPNPDGSFNIRLVDIETGEEIYARLSELSEGGWIIDYPDPHNFILIDTIETYETNEPYCYYGTEYIILNLDVPPFDQLEARQALAGITDIEAYLQNMYGSTEGLTHSLIPHEFLGEYASQYEDVEYNFIPETASLINASEQLSLGYCGACEDYDWMAEGFTSIWKKVLGIDINLVSIPYEEYQDPIKGSTLPFHFKAYSASSWLDFVKYAVEEGTFMIPDREYESFMKLVEEAALEADKEKRAQKIMELDHLLVEKYVSVIPIRSYIYCGSFY